ncbi:hypothetical protein [Ruegeria hyattellae]
MNMHARHWWFGEMPLVEDLTRANVENIIASVRELNQDNGMS